MSDWPALIRLATVRLRIPPEAFWRLSVKEWAALTASPPTDALGRRDFDGLVAAYPDHRPKRGSAPHPTLSPEGEGRQV